MTLSKPELYSRNKLISNRNSNHSSLQSCPKIRSDDDGTWRRLKVILFDSKFVRQHEIKRQWKKNGLPPKHFMADSKLSERIPEWKQTFMGILLEYYAKYRKAGFLTHPRAVMKETESYRKRCDVFQDFLGDYVDKVMMRRRLSLQLILT